MVERHQKRRLRGYASLAAFAVLALAWAGSARAADMAAEPVTRDESPEAKTLKERLSDKASDEQRVDNCRVPPGERGPKPRPGCSADDARASTAAGKRERASPHE